ncbi:MetS family NSS transporter small subunit [Leucobacter triazinivorans]|uniref:MetS family NSS transporter small subunit n=1 Tax=Leucobacter triazinivorans TaxID=1784719 RepID=A0A4P6KD66_9MICO|nr:MetS family NSS transporter small subunit [Leucobacter triazinivorans]QBE47851.1 MetS family NSS transporter small subunit [Leucobacter triazinivorans]
MTPVAILFLALSTAIVWGGLIASALFLGRRPEIPEYPRGGDEPLGAENSGRPEGRES